MPLGGARGKNIGHLYKGHSRINDNEFISRKVSFDSVLFIMPHIGHIYYLFVPEIWCIYHGYNRCYANLNMTL